jgi:hypothetical protein
MIGISIANSLGLNKLSAGINPDAAAFIAAANITDPTQISAINDLVNGLQTDGIWTKMKAIYPFVGGTASTHKWNLKDPRDLDAAFRLVFNGGWTHSSTGATPNGTNGYADTKFNQATYLTQTNGEIGSYLRTNTTGTYVDMGCHFAGSDYALITKLADNNFYGRIATLDINSNYQPATTLGLFAVRANGTNSAKFTRNGTTQATKATTTFAIESLNIGMGSAINATGGIYFSPRQTAFNYISDSLTDTEAANLYTRVQTYQTALSRQV